MSTANFSSPNASAVFAFAMNEYDEEGNFVEDFDGFNYDCAIENIQDSMVSRFKEDKKFDVIKVVGDNSVNTVIARVDIDREEFMGKYVSLQCDVNVESGYYEGAQADWNLKVIVGDYEWDSTETITDYDIRQALSYYSDFNEGLIYSNAPKLLKWIETNKEVLTTEVEKVLEQCTSPLVCTARFSNGEAMYQLKSEVEKKGVQVTYAY